MKRLIKILGLPFFMLMCLLPAGCDEFCDGLLSQEPETMVSDVNFRRTEDDVAAMTAQLHARLRNCFRRVEARAYRDRGLPFDFKGYLWANISRNELEKSWTLTSSVLDWRNEYGVIAVANQIIDNIHRAGLPADRRDYYLGQAYVVRAWMYFYILRTWGDAPLVLKSFDKEAHGRAPWREIAGKVMSDLREAAVMLPPAGELKDKGGAKVMSKQVASRGTAWALLVHVCAWTAALNDEPELRREALRAADEVIGGGEYALVGSPAEVCSTVLQGNSQEGIFELDFYDIEGEENLAGSTLALFCETWPVVPIYTSATPRMNLRLSFEAVDRLYPDAGDLRRKEYFYELDSTRDFPEAVNQNSAYIWKFRRLKFHESGWLAGLPRILDQNEILVRLPDILLLRAELRELEGDIAGAIADLNTVRKRAGARPYSPAEGSLKRAIFMERLRELFCEGIQTYFFDALRTGYYKEVLDGRFRTVADRDALYLPVGVNAFYFNPVMRQNAYWARNGFAI